MVRRITEQDFEDISEGYREDVRRIIRVAQSHGIILTPQEAYQAWSDFSDTMAAGWMSLDMETDGSLWYALPEWARGEKLCMRCNGSEATKKLETIYGTKALCDYCIVKVDQDGDDL